MRFTSAHFLRSVLNLNCGGAPSCGGSLRFVPLPLAALALAISAASRASLAARSRRCASSRCALRSGGRVSAARRYPSTDRCAARRACAQRKHAWGCAGMAAAGTHPRAACGAGAPRPSPSPSLSESPSSDEPPPPPPRAAAAGMAARASSLRRASLSGVSGCEEGREHAEANEAAQQPHPSSTNTVRLPAGRAPTKCSDADKRSTFCSGTREMPSAVSVVRSRSRRSGGARLALHLRLVHHVRQVLRLRAAAA